MEVTLQHVATQVAAIATQLEEFSRKQLDEFSGMETRLTLQAKRNFDELTHQATLNLDKLKRQAKLHVDELSQQAKLNLDELNHQARLNLEELKQEVRLLGEGYVATLEGIERELADLNKKVDIKFRDHDLVLTDHNQRISELEKRR